MTPSDAAGGKSPVAPLLFDNLGELRAQYEATLSEYRAKRTHVVNALIMLSFFGGLALALLVTMLALLRIVWGSRLWLPTVVAMVCCVVVTAVSNEPSRMKPVEATAVGFAPCAAAPDAEPKEQDRGESAAASHAGRQQAAKSCREAEQDGGRCGRTEVRSICRAAVRHGPTGDAAPATKMAETVGLVSAVDGRRRWPRNVARRAAAAGKALRLVIDAHGDGRIESCESVALK